MRARSPSLIVKLITDPTIGLGEVQQDEEGNLLNRHELWKTTIRSGKGTPSQLLATLEICLIVEMRGIYGDYFAMSRRCCEVMRTIVKALEGRGFQADMSSRLQLRDEKDLAWAANILCNLDLDTWSRAGLFTKTPYSVTSLDVVAQTMAAWTTRHGSIGMTLLGIGHH